MSDIEMASLEELRAMKGRGGIGPPRPNAKSVDLPADFWENAEVKAPIAKQPVNLRVDEDILSPGP